MVGVAPCEAAHHMVEVAPVAMKVKSGRTAQRQLDDWIIRSIVSSKVGSCAVIQTLLHKLLVSYHHFRRGNIPLVNSLCRPRRTVNSGLAWFSLFRGHGIHMYGVNCF
jgi:hypothetical protein